MLQTALRFLDGHKEITLATCEGNLPKLRVFQVMKREGNMLYFATSPEKAAYPELPGDADALAQALYKK